MSAASDSPTATLLRKTAIFSGLNQEELDFLTSRVIQRKFSAGELVFTEGEPCSGMHVVETGSIRIFKSSSGGREQVLSIDGPGGSIAELPVFDGGSYPASAQAITPTTTVFLSKQDFQNLCRQHPEVALKILRVVGGRLRRLVGIIEELSFTTVRHRLAALLIRLAKSASNTKDAPISFSLPATNSELAAQIGTVRELVSRNLSRMQSEGLIGLDGRTVTVPDLQKLEAELADAS